ncbi:hypothetical protein [Sphaerisporangium rhizosphaerae]|uniref:SAM-dependent methyltransferase n=1 Tax=Sphaerisporangium rhizosphaerae TaxID=2269375 RepID=A0ABW2P7X1_9ACTN
MPSSRTELWDAYETTARHMDDGAHDGAHVLTDVFDCDAPRAELLARLGFERFRAVRPVGRALLRRAGADACS